MELASFAPGSIRRFFRKAIGASESKSTSHRTSVEEFLAGLRPDNLGEAADRFVSEAIGRTLLATMMGVIRELPVQTWRPILEKSAQSDGAGVFAKLPRSARRDFRAVLFLAHRGLEGVTQDQVIAVLSELQHIERVPPEVRRVTGFVLLLVLAGALGLAPDNAAEEAARELWLMAAAGEPKDAVEDAFDAAEYWEAHADQGGPVPFDPAALST